MLDWTALLPKLVLWNILFFISYLVFKYYVLPRIIQYAVEVAPLEAPDADLNEFKLVTLDDIGFKMYVDSTLAGSQIPSLRWGLLDALWIRIRLGQISIKEIGTDKLVGYLDLSNPIMVTAVDDCRFVQNIRFDFHENASALKSIIQRISFVGPNELRLISIRVTFRLSLSIMDLFVVDSVECGKTINLGELRDVLKAQAEAAKEAHSKASSASSSAVTSRIASQSLGSVSTSTASISSAINDLAKDPKEDSLVFDNSYSSATTLDEEDSMCDTDSTADMDQKLFPNPEINVFANPKLRSVEAGLEIEFSAPPKFNFDIGTIEFTLMLHNSQFAKVVVTGMCLREDSRFARLVVQVLPSALSSRPITGAVTSMKGIIKGVVKGAKNGFLFGEWGAEAMILGVKDIKINNENDREVWWIKELLQGIEFEHDVEAVKKIKSRVGKKTRNLSSAIGRMCKAALFPISGSNN